MVIQMFQVVLMSSVTVRTQNLVQYCLQSFMDLNLTAHFVGTFMSAPAVLSRCL